MFLALEIASALCNIGFVVGMINQRIWAWPMGLIGCLAAAVMFESSQLHAEAFLNVLYAALAIYGWVTWQGNNQAMMVVHRAQRKVWWGLAAIIMTLALGWAMKTQTSNPLPFVDAGIFSLSVIATLWQIGKRLDNWHLWIVINAISVWLCINRGLYVYAGYSAVLFAMSFSGLRSWRSVHEAQSH